MVHPFGLATGPKSIFNAIELIASPRELVFHCYLKYYAQFSFVKTLANDALLPLTIIQSEVCEDIKKHLKSFKSTLLFSASIWVPNINDFHLLFMAQMGVASRHGLSTGAHVPLFPVARKGGFRDSHSHTSDAKASTQTCKRRFRLSLG